MIFPILLLSAAGFTVLTTEFIIVGLLPPMARELGVSVSQAGLLVTLFAFTVAGGGPFLTAYFSRFDRKRLFIATLLLFSAANLLAALAPNIATMAVARLVPALALPVFWSLASETAADLMGPEQAGRGISILTFGIICATIFGIPIGTLIGDAFGWRAAFGALSALALAKAAMLSAFLPARAAPAKAPPLRGQFALLRDRVLVGQVLWSMLIFTGMFTGYTYLADLLERVAGFDGSWVGWTLMAFGGVGLLGNALAGRRVDRDPLGTTLLFSVSTAAGMALVAALVTSRAGLAASLTLWGLSQAALFLVCHVRVMKAAPSAPAFAASLNISGANLGIGIGAIVGGGVIDRWGVAHVGEVGAAVLFASTLLGGWLVAASRPRPVPAGACAGSCPGR
ncbi:MFS transporter [Eleftheria terrae]|uniref:MFS transporter n=1 Tax=Eleftheria terrae TaxID=1597781 RepID=UPI00263BA664|nr:MFS transporter [Eleftheria terrae]WKB51789.1 MFS transporter [Eleftheria terrae]